MKNIYSFIARHKARTFLLGVAVMLGLIAVSTLILCIFPELLATRFSHKSSDISEKETFSFRIPCTGSKTGSLSFDDVKLSVTNQRGGNKFTIAYPSQYSAVRVRSRRPESSPYLLNFEREAFNRVTKGGVETVEWTITGDYAGINAVDFRFQDKEGNYVGPKELRIFLECENYERNHEQISEGGWSPNRCSFIQNCSVNALQLKASGEGEVFNYDRKAYFEENQNTLKLTEKKYPDGRTYFETIGGENRVFDLTDFSTDRRYLFAVENTETSRCTGKDGTVYELVANLTYRKTLGVLHTDICGDMRMLKFGEYFSWISNNEFLVSVTPGVISKYAVRGNPDGLNTALIKEKPDFTFDTSEYTLPWDSVFGKYIVLQSNFRDGGKSDLTIYEFSNKKILKKLTDLVRFEGVYYDSVNDGLVVAMGENIPEPPDYSYKIKFWYIRPGFWDLKPVGESQEFKVHPALGVGTPEFIYSKGTITVRIINFDGEVIVTKITL